MPATVRHRKPEPTNHAGNGRRPARRPLAKAPTGIPGLDEITSGGLPRGRPTLVCGGAGCGKTLLAMEFLVRGALEYDEPGVFMSFEETTDDLVENAQSLGFDLRRLRAPGVAVGHARAVGFPLGRVPPPPAAAARLRGPRAQQARGERRLRSRGVIHPAGPRD